MNPTVYRNLAAVLLAASAAGAQPAPRPAPGVFIRLPAAIERTAGALRIHAARSQQSLQAWLSAERAEFRAYWITNAVYLPRPDAALVQRLRAAGYRVEAERVYEVPPPIDPRAAPAPQGIEWGVTMVKAPELWAKGLQGQGAVVGIIDTGFERDHPALSGRWRGDQEGGALKGNWKDPSNICQGAVCDNNGHGTHVAGSILGDDGAGNQVGVAPAARFIACKGCESGWCSESALLTCGQWVLDPYEDGSGRGRPGLVSNSWGGASGDTWFQDAVQAWQAAGILPVFAAGNSGPNCGTVNSPGDYPESLAVGAVDSARNAATFSSRGPSRLQDAQKPQVSAPGVNVRSAWPGKTYMTISGTSMATPHVSGVVALLWATAQGDAAAIRKALQAGAAPRASQACGESAPIPNLTYGWGIVDALGALGNLAPAPPTPPTIDRFTAEPETIRPGDSARLEWDTSHADRVSLQGEAVAPDGFRLVSPPATTSYELVAAGPGGTTSRSITVRVVKPPNQPPRLEVLEPAHLARFQCGTPIRFSGRATDPEDGDLSAQIVWWNLYPFWRGTPAEAVGMSGAGCDIGWHYVTAEVTDSAGARVESEVWIEVTAPVGAAATALTDPPRAAGQRVPIRAWWGECQLDLEAIGQRLARALRKWSAQLGK